MIHCEICFLDCPTQNAYVFHECIPQTVTQKAVKHDEECIATYQDNLNVFIGPGGAPTRTSILPDKAEERKNFPVASGVLDYFPDALVAISEISKVGNDQHNPGKSLRWDRSKSGDEADTCIRHFLQRGTRDVDGKRHTAKAAWRMLAILQKEIESEEK